MPAAPLSVDALRAAVSDGSIDTVVLAIVDMQGRLQGKRCDADYFLNDVLESRHRGLQLPARRRRRDEHRRRLRDLVLGTRLRRLRHGARPGHPAQGRRGSPAPRMLLADVEWLDGSPVVESPRQILKRQLDRLDERGWDCFVGTELEFIVFDDSFEQAFDKRYSDLRPSNQYNLDYSILGDQPGRAAAARDPARHARRRHAGRVGQGRVQPRPAGDRVQVHRRARRPATTT